MGRYLQTAKGPDRLDPNEFNCKRAHELGVRISMGTDCHATSGLETMRLGVGIARRAWLEKSDVLNCVKR